MEATKIKGWDFYRGIGNNTESELFSVYQFEKGMVYKSRDNPQYSAWLSSCRNVWVVNENSAQVPRLIHKNTINHIQFHVKTKPNE